jgi:hypothetical protein
VQPFDAVLQCVARGGFFVSGTEKRKQMGVSLLRSRRRSPRLCC